MERLYNITNYGEVTGEYVILSWNGQRVYLLSLESRVPFSVHPLELFCKCISLGAGST